MGKRKAGPKIKEIKKGRMKNNKVYYALVIPESELSRMQVKDPFNSANEMHFQAIFSPGPLGKKSTLL